MDAPFSRRLCTPAAEKPVNTSAVAASMRRFLAMIRAAPLGPFGGCDAKTTQM